MLSVRSRPSSRIAFVQAAGLSQSRSPASTAASRRIVVRVRPAPTARTHIPAQIERLDRCKCRCVASVRPESWHSSIPVVVSARPRTGARLPAGRCAEDIVAGHADVVGGGVPAQCTAVVGLADTPAQPRRDRGRRRRIGRRRPASCTSSFPKCCPARHSASPLRPRPPSSSLHDRRGRQVLRGIVVRSGR
jgi:hypothetical protein